MPQNEAEEGPISTLFPLDMEYEDDSAWLWSSTDLAPRGIFIQSTREFPTSSRIDDSLSRTLEEGDEDDDTPTSPLINTAHVHASAMYILDALDGVRYHPKCLDLSQWARACHRFRRRYLLVYSRVTIWVLILLAFFEAPSWCIENPDACQDIDNYPRTNIEFVSATTSCLIQWGCMIVLWLDLVLLFISQGYMRERHRTWALCFFLVLALTEAIMTTIYAACDSKVKAIKRVGMVAVTLGPYTRVGLLVCNSRGIRNEIALILRIVPGFFRVMIPMTLFIGASDLCALVLFPTSTKAGADYFRNFGEGLWSLVMLLTTANFPTIMIDAFRANKSSCIFFFTFIIIGMYFFLNLILSVVINAYDEQTDAMRQKVSQDIRTNLLEAYKLLDVNNRGYIHVDVVRQLCSELSYFHRFQHINDEVSRIIITFLDVTGENRIDQAAFMKLAQVLRLRFQRLNTATCLERRFPGILESRTYIQVRDFIRSYFFDYFLDILVSLNAVLALLQTLRERDNDLDDPQVRHASAMLQIVFTTMYTLELCLKIGAMGWRTYIHKYPNRFDFLVTMGAIVMTTLNLLPCVVFDPSLLRLVLVLRFLRISRILVRFPDFRIIGNTFHHIVPAAATNFTTLFCILYIFAALGMHVWGGRITRDPTNPDYAKVINTAFAKSDYWDQNFNDLVSGMAALFIQLPMASTNDLATAFAELSSTFVARMYWLIFWMVTVLIVVNVMFAFVLQTFLKEFTRNRAIGPHETGDGVRIINDRNAILSADFVNGTPSRPFIRRLYAVQVPAQGKIEGDMTIEEIVASNNTTTHRSNASGNNRLASTSDSSGARIIPVPKGGS